MTAVETKLEFLSDLPLYKTEKPFIATYDQSDHVHRPDTQNVEWTEYPLKIQDLRSENNLQLHTAGFEVINHMSESTPLLTPEDMEKYRQETAQLLHKQLDAEAVVCYDVKLRHCGEYDTSEFVDLAEIMMLEGAPNGAHVDSSFDFAPELIKSRLKNEEALKYLKPGHRVRVINTWRPLLPKIEHRPLAVCDYRTVHPDNLVATDRVYPHRVIEVYYLTYHPDQKWYWCSDQSQDELLLMMTYDSAGGDTARFCPHVSFHNPNAPDAAPPRRSVETRSIVISKL